MKSRPLAGMNYPGKGGRCGSFAPQNDRFSLGNRGIYANEGVEIVMAVMKMKCHCGKIIEANVGDCIYNNNLRWYQTYCCENCGNVAEIDGIGNMPLEIKQRRVCLSFKREKKQC